MQAFIFIGFVILIFIVLLAPSASPSASPGPDPEPVKPVEMQNTSPSTPKVMSNPINTNLSLTQVLGLYPDYTGISTSDSTYLLYVPGKYSVASCNSTSSPDNCETIGNSSYLKCAAGSKRDPLDPSSCLADTTGNSVPPSPVGMSLCHSYLDSGTRKMVYDYRKDCNAN
jgi:hypothetical protein